MSTIKILVTATVVIAILYAAYVVINRTPESGGEPPGYDQNWNALDISPGAGADAPTYTSPSVGGGAAPPFTPSAPSYASSAPPFTPTAPPSGTLGSSPAGPPASAGGLTDTFPSSSADATKPPESAALPPYGASAPPYGAAPTPGDPPAAGDSPRVLAPPPSAPPEVTATGATAAADDFESFMQQVADSLRGSRLTDAHLTLSRRYQAESGTPAQRRQMEQVLDQLAGTVVYSREHLLEPAHRVAPTETLQEIANQYNVPSGLLAKINGLDPAAPLRAGQELKVVRGPFSALIDLERYELTLLLPDGRYAGRFSIGVGPDMTAPACTLAVSDKTDTSAMGAGVNPIYGSRWIGLGQRIGLHGTNSPQDVGHAMTQGCIALSPRDIEDLYDILSIGSRVVVRR